ncbi:hypothetical protein HK101_010484 [Irineochytrium annulatum]|nr:hypothetical protein HK101_010484 [Irineochytrium annulatum]
MDDILNGKVDVKEAVPPNMDKVEYKPKHLSSERNGEAVVSMNDAVEVLGATAESSVPAPAEPPEEELNMPALTEPHRETVESSAPAEPLKKTMKAANAAHSDKEEISARVQKDGYVARKTSLDYSRFEKINVDDDYEDDVSTRTPPMSASVPPANVEKKDSTEKAGEKKKPTDTKTKKYKSADDLLRGESNRHKEAGNAAFKSLNLDKAEECYAAAIATCLQPTRELVNDLQQALRCANGVLQEDPFAFLDKLSLPPPNPIQPEPALFTNRATVRLRMEKWEGAEQDCSEALKLLDAQSAPSRHSHIRLHTLTIYKAAKFWRKRFGGGFKLGDCFATSVARKKTSVG